MGMGLVSQDDFLNELSNCERKKKSINTDAPETVNQTDFDLPPDPEIVDIKSRGRSEGDNNVPQSLRKLIADTANLEGRKEALELAKMFDISPSSASAYANGATSTKSYHQPNSDILNFIKNRKGKITRKALSKITNAIDKIDDAKLDNLDAKELSAVAKDLSAVVKHMEPPAEQVNGGESNQPRFIVYAPQITQENNYETIQVSE